MKFLWEQLDLIIFPMPLESPPYLIWFVRYLYFKFKFLRSLESRNSFGCILFLGNLTTESGNVV